MKLTTTALLISAALAAVTSGAPLVMREPSLPGTNVNSHVIAKRCTECTPKDNIALDLIVKTSADHYSTIAQTRLNSLMTEIESASVTAGGQELPREKAVLSVTVRSKIEEAKKACAPEVLAPKIKETIVTDASLDIPWSKQDAIQQKMVELDLMLTRLMLDRIQASIDAERLSKDCAEKITNTEIAPAPANVYIPPQPKPVTVPEPVTPPPPPPPAAEPAPVAAESIPPSDSEAGIDVPSSVDSKFVCKSGCKDSQDAKIVLGLRVNLENEFKPRLDQFYDQEVPTACTEKREALLGGFLKVVANLNVNANVNADAKA
jgi:hypothetical protein